MVLIGGDGILYEFINGWMPRKDWRPALDKLPIGIIPGGTGNALALSMLYAKGESWDPESMAYLIVKGGTEKCDLAAGENSKQKMYSFLS